MSSFSIDPVSMLGNMAEGLTGQPIIIGLSSLQAPVPNFVVGVTTRETAHTSNTLPGFQLSGGDLFLKGARNQGEYSFRFIISETPNVKNQTVENIAKALQIIGKVAQSFASFGAVLPNLSGLSANFAVQQLTALQAMKDGFQPIMALNLFMPFDSFSTTNPYLTSAWYISDIRVVKEESERGAVVDIDLKELLMKRDTSLSLFNIVKNLANELIGPMVGSSIGSVL